MNLAFPHRLNMHAFGVKVICIEPGFFKTNVTDTEILMRNVQQLWDKLPQEIKEEYGDDFVPKGKLPVDLFIEQSWYQQ